MKNLFDPATASEVVNRIATLTPVSPRQWGTMSVAQAMAHCAIAMEWGVGQTHPEPTPIFVRLMGRIVKPLAMRNDDPMRKNSPTAKSLLMKDEPELDESKQRLTQLIERFVSGGPAKCTTHPHPFFGKMTPDEWAILMYKHADHHLRQFGA